MIALFVGFGFLIGILFGFFGMGGSFLITPALLVLGYPARVAVGSGLAFVFGTSVIGALKHRDHGQIDYRLAALMTLGMALGIELGKRVVFLLEELGSADLVVSIAYVGLLAVVGLFTLRNARTGSELISSRSPSQVRTVHSSTHRLVRLRSRWSGHSSLGVRWARVLGPAQRNWSLRTISRATSPPCCLREASRSERTS
jgi:uncharacterized protein